MAKEYAVKRKLQDQGGSLLVSLPRIWVDSEGLQEGDEVLIKFDSSKGLRLYPGKGAGHHNPEN